MCLYIDSIECRTPLLLMSVDPSVKIFAYMNFVIVSNGTQIMVGSIKLLSKLIQLCATNTFISFLKIVLECLEHQLLTKNSSC